jgi:hypothetical protein
MFVHQRFLVAAAMGLKRLKRLKDGGEKRKTKTRSGLADESWPVAVASALGSQCPTVATSKGGSGWGN